jgi:diguanylate cyclase (GGDEF)-like protein/PAS domain S-box-containing protein
MQGGKGLIVVSPIYCQGQFEGCFAAAFRVDVIAWELSLDDQEAGYEVSLFQGPREVYGRSPALQGGNRRLAEANIAYGDSALRVGVCPSVQTIAEQGQALRGVSIVTGILRVIAATLLAFFAQRAFEHSRTAKRAAERARESEWRFRAIFDQTFQFIGLLTTDGTLVEANRTALQFAGIPEADVIGKPFWQTPWWRHSFDLQQQLRAAIARAAKGECIRFEASHVNADGETRFVDFSLKPVYDDVGHIHMLVPEGRDITDRKRAEDELTRAARLDKLTGLPSRGLLLDRLRETIARARESENYRYALMFLDFDRFKLINDSLGHDAGDDLLRQIAARLRGNIRSIHSVSRSEIGNTAARLGGDEFVVLLDEVELHSDVLVIAKRLLSAFAQPYRLATQDVYSTASIGIVNGGPEYEQAEDVLRDADTAMYEAKRAGKARYVVFDTSMRERLQRRVRLESDLRKAIENGELSLACQPIVSLSTGEILSVEMLLRWMHPTEGLIEPGEFVPIAEESDLMYGLSEWVLVTGCQHMAAWIQTLGSAAPATVSINLSRRQFAMPGLFGFIEQVLRQTGLDPQRLQLEIAEDVFVVDERTAIDTMRALRGLGVHLAIDDFGAGTSTFASIHRFPVDMFKVDRSLLAGIEESPDTAALIHALAVLLKNLSICLVAEGVETADQALTLQELGCHHAQGDFFAAPMAASEFEEFISRSISIDHSESGAMAFEARWADRLSL